MVVSSAASDRRGSSATDTTARSPGHQRRDSKCYMVSVVGIRKF